jgi:hypothetical protein
MTAHLSTGRLLVGIALLILAATAGCSKSSTAPSKTTTYTLSGTVSDASSGTGIEGATVQITNSPTQTVTTDSSGRYSFSNVSAGSVTLQFSAAAHTTQTTSVSVSANTVMNVSLARAATTFTLTGAVTDGTSHGVLPNITVQVTNGSGQTTTTDGSGRYSISGLSGTVNLQFSATSYTTQTASVTVNADTTLNVVLQRAAPTLTSVTVSCTPSTIQYDVSTAQCTATAHFQDGTTSTVTNSSTWSSSSPVAGVSATGVVSPQAYINSIVQVTITAIYQGVSGTFAMTVKSCHSC